MERWCSGICTTFDLSRLRCTYLSIFLQDYITHYSKLVEKYGEPAEKELPISTTASGGIQFSVTSAPKPSVPKLPEFNFPVAPPVEIKSSINAEVKPPVSSGFNFSFDTGANKSSTAGYSFVNDQKNDSKPTIEPFKFPPLTGFNTSALSAPDSQPTAPVSKPFSFSAPFSATQPAFSTAPTASGTTEDDEDGGEPILEPEKVYKNENDSDEVLHEVPCKLFRLDLENGSEWKDIGKGTFRVTKAADSNKQRMLIRNPIGKITFNASFYPNMKLEKTKTGVRFSAFVESTNNKSVLNNFLVKLKATDVDSTISRMEASIQSVGK